ncbi:hypothetical protein MACJ_002913 [Theileria orientalis]|uniref:RNA-binding protein 25 n=1 Tax=Theileria orientalis TaxID=68886 RepID=A0A976M703_THEOR|nr:hypothetical protein MACJ_002913 [Theileria orientalis]
MNNNQGVPQNLKYNMPLQQPFMVGSPNIAPNVSQHPSQIIMMGGINQGYNSYPYPPPVMEHQPTENAQDNKSYNTSFPPHLVNSNTPNYPNVKGQNITNVNNTQGTFGFHPPMMNQPTIITAPPTVIPQPTMPGMMGNPAMMSPPIMSPPMMNPPLINNAQAPLMNKSQKVPPMMNFPMKPLIDTLLNPVVVTVPQKDDSPKLANVVYVGGLTTDTTNEFVINMLQKCGKTSHFKRHTDPSSGLLATFAFCDFESPGGAYYAIECLNGLKYGDNVLKVSCNSRVKCQIDDWKVGKIEEMCLTNSDKNKDQVLKMFEEYKAKLRSEFTELITIHIKTQPSGKEGENGEENEPESLEGEEKDKAEELQEETPKSTSKESKEKQVKDEDQILSKKYTVNKKELDRLFKLKQKRKSYDSKYKEQLPDWEYEEEKLFKKLKALQTVSASRRERLIKDDLAGISKPNLKHRSREIEEDFKDEQEELDENKSKKITMKILKPSASASTLHSYRHLENASRSSSASRGTATSVDHREGSITSRSGAKSSRAGESEPDSAKRHRADGISGFGGIGAYTTEATSDRSAASTSKRVKVVSVFATEAEEVKKPTLTEKEIWLMVPTDGILEFKLDWDLLFSTNLSILIEPWIRRCILEYMGNEESLVGEVLEFIFSRLKERPGPQELLFDVEQFLDEESEGFVKQLWRLLAFHQIRLKSQ